MKNSLSVRCTEQGRGGGQQPPPRMLTEADRELITAAVDGELTPVQVAVFRRLLANSTEAEQLYGYLMGDSTQMKALPKLVAPAQLAPRVMTSVSQLPRSTPNTLRKRTPRREPRVGWVPYAVAASTLIAVAAGSYWFSSRQADDEPNRVAQQRTLPNTSHDHSRGSVAVPVESSREVVSAPRAFSAQHDPLVAVPDVVPEAAPYPRLPGIGRDAVGFPPFDDEPFRLIEARLPFLAPLSGFKHEETRAKLRTELAMGPAFRLDLFAKDPNNAAQVFLASAKSVGLNVTIDAIAADRLKKRAYSFWVVYVETMTVEDIEKLLVQLAADTKGDKAGSGLSAAHLITAGVPEQKELRDLLGSDMGILKRPEAGPKSIASGTADQIAKTLQKDVKQGLLLTHLPTNGRAAPGASKEVKQFLFQRSTRTADSIPLMIVIRSGP